MPQSLQGRMLAMSALVTAAALLGRFAVNQVDRRLNSELSLLAGAVDRDGHVDEARLRRNPTHFQGWPDWQWRVRTPSRTISSAGFREIGLPLPAHMVGGAEQGKTSTLQTRRGPIELTAVQPLGPSQQRMEFALG